LNNLYDSLEKVAKKKIKKILEGPKIGLELGTTIL